MVKAEITTEIPSVLKRRGKESFWPECATEQSVSHHDIKNSVKNCQWWTNQSSAFNELVTNSCAENFTLTLINILIFLSKQTPLIYHERFLLGFLGQIISSHIISAVVNFPPSLQVLQHCDFWNISKSSLGQRTEMNATFLEEKKTPNENCTTLEWITPHNCIQAGLLWKSFYCSRRIIPNNRSKTVFWETSHWAGFLYIPLSVFPFWVYNLDCHSGKHYEMSWKLSKSMHQLPWFKLAEIHQDSYEFKL